MKKQFDTTRIYAVALGGGGAKGGYEIGIWRSLTEEGVRYNAVSGTSVGALNGALMTMGRLEEAEELWRNIRFSQVMAVEDSMMSRLYEGNLKASEMRPILRRAIGIVREGGFDVTPLRNLLEKYVDTQKIAASAVRFYIVTYSLTDKKEMDICVNELPPEKMCDMLLASAYYPAFKSERLDGKLFTDGGIADSLPVTPLIKRGCKDIIAIRLSGGFGVEKRVKTPEGVKVSYIEPTRKLGSTLNFSAEQAEYNMKLGYYDAKRFIYGLVGSYYYIDRTLTENSAYNILVRMLRGYMSLTGTEASLRAMHETVLPRMAKEYGSTGDYYDLLIKYLEKTGEKLAVPEFEIMTDDELVSRVNKACYTSYNGADAMPKCLTRL